MGTRSLTFVYGDEGPIINMYRQFDGYPSGHGLELAEFLKPFIILNGYSNPNAKNQANGMGCLAAQIVAHFKTGIGGFYLTPIHTLNQWQDYEYHVYQNKVIVKDPDNIIFSGTWEEFYEFCTQED